METADNLMRTGVLIYCPDCEVDTIFVAPDLDDLDPAELACTLCAAAVLVDLCGPSSGDQVSRVA
ncbi:MAG TPA: hypothetical protein VFJ14_02630 [Nocardioidaceae bacterium]|nr:hypothetical protein [Nocardioidaceae bacterium]